jgi:hypothetical protein
MQDYEIRVLDFVLSHALVLTQRSPEIRLYGIAFLESYVPTLGSRWLLPYTTTSCGELISVSQGTFTVDHVPRRVRPMSFLPNREVSICGSMQQRQDR